MIKLERLLELRSAWNILAVLFLAVFVNVITQLPDNLWASASWKEHLILIAGMAAILFAGIYFQILFELAAGCLMAKGNLPSEAAKYFEDDSLGKRLKKCFYLGASAAVVGIVCILLYRSQILIKISVL